VEMALVTLVFSLFVIGIVDFSRALFAYDSVANAAKLATRYAIVHGDGYHLAKGVPVASADDVKNYVLATLPGLVLDPSVVKVYTTWEDPLEKSGTWVNVQVAYSFSFILSLIPDQTIVSSSRMVISF
jgi:hypothetical protein